MMEEETPTTSPLVETSTKSTADKNKHQDVMKL